MEEWELLKGLPDPVLLLEDGRIADCNDAACAAYGYRRDELLGQSLSLLQPQPDLLLYAQEARGARVQVVLRCRNGDLVPAEASVSSIRSGGKSTVLAVFRSVAEERRQIERLEMQRREIEAVLDGLQELVAVQDREGTVVWVNRAAGESVSQRPDQLIGRKCYEIWHQRGVRCEDCPVARCWETLKPEEDIVTSPDGRHWLIKGTPVFSSSGEMIAVAETTIDITALENARRELAEHRAFLRSVIDSLPLHVYVKDRDGRFRMLNKAAVQALGASSEEECLGKTDFDYLPLEEAEQLRRQEEQVLQQGAMLIDVESHFTDSRGRQRWYWTTKVPLRNTAGEVVGLVGSNRDVTDLKLSEIALRESEERYRKLVEHSPSAIVLLVDGRVRYANPKALEMAGAPSMDAVLGMDVSALLHPEDREPAGRILEELKERDALPPVEFRLVRLDGKVIWLEVVGIATTYGNTRAIQLVGRDITERKEREAALERLSRAIHQAGESVQISDADGTVLYVNPAFERITGYTAEEVLGQSITGFAGSIADEALAREISQTVRAGKVWAGRAVMRRKDGRPLYVSLTVSPILDDAGRFVSAVSVAEDVTDRVRLENELREAQKMEAVGRLAGGIAHDFNNLLTVIIASGDMLLRRLKPDDPAAKLVRQIRDASDRAASLTRQLLAFSRKQVLEPKVLDLNAVVRGMEDMLRRLIGEHIRLSLVLEPELWAVKADPSQIEQVIMNLAVNAKDAMPDGGELTIETENVELDESYARRHAGIVPGPYVMLAVSDTGHGMDQETQSHIFEPFFTTKGVGRGTGMGLSTVYGIVRQSGGHIWVYSEPGEGTTFKVFLPRTEEVSEAETVRALEVRGGTETILVAEDNASVRDVTCSLLRSLGYTVLEAEAPEDAAELCRQASPAVSLLLTDVVMPGVSGRKLADTLKGICPGLKVLYMSGYTDNAIAHHGVLDEGVQFLQKPFTRESLARKVREVLDQP